jgi:hypothetical protein
VGFDTVMIRICWWLVDVASRLLQPAERDAVRGDLAESDASAGQALGEVLGLVVRRQAGLWKQWQPWLALLGVAGIAGLFLSAIALRFSIGLEQQVRTWLHYGVPFDTGLTIGREIVRLLCLAVALSFWSWTSGFVLGSLSGSAVWLTGALFFGPLLLTLFSIVTGPVIPLLYLVLGAGPALVFALPTIWGVQQGLKWRTLRFRHALILTFAAAFLTLLVTWTGGWTESAHQVWSKGLWHGIPWQRRLPPLLLVVWPVGYILATAKERHT